VNSCQPLITRRHFGAGAVSATLALGACAAPSALVRPQLTTNCPLPVHVRHERLIRELVGLRPYRENGFVVRREVLGAKNLVHNYGHGGAGITLSWGTSKLATGLGLPGHEGAVAIIGAGIIGLTTARLVQEAGFPATIYAAALPPETTSNKAGAGWYPSSLFKRDALTPDFQRQMDAALRYAYRRFQLLTGPEYGVRWMKQYEIYKTPAPTGPKSWFTSMMETGFLPEVRELNPGEHPFGETYVRQYTGMVIETERLLRQLLRDFQMAGGKVVVRKFNSATELSSLSEGLIFNATGLGSRMLFGDTSLRPMRGQLAVLLPQPEVDYSLSHEGGFYMFSRTDGIVLGGTNELDDWNLTPDPTTTERLLRGHQQIFSTFRCTGLRS
jgi:D-amino-acid oxidase